MLATVSATAAGPSSRCSFGEDAQFDQAFQLGPGAFEVLRQYFVAEGLAHVLGPQGPVDSLKSVRMCG
ncbi:hypothetical protein ADK70_16455 [Streptomyces rimosus subsp. pseudoverticillatus]|nr:hypothetical protein ADK70_16455 [Streptomyces rimosus subsp. pseudoverticillatus]